MGWSDLQLVSNSSVVDGRTFRSGWRSSFAVRQLHVMPLGDGTSQAKFHIERRSGMKCKVMPPLDS